MKVKALFLASAMTLVSASAFAAEGGAAVAGSTPDSATSAPAQTENAAAPAAAKMHHAKKGKKHAKPHTR